MSVGTSYLLALINPVEGKEDEFNEWYNNVHLKEVVAVEGILSARRFKMHETQMMESQPHKYVAMYEIEHGEEAEVVRNLEAAVPGMNMAPVAEFDLANSMIIESITGLVKP